VKRFIAAGDIYQANLSHRLDFPWKGDPADFFDALRRLNPSPYAALMEFPGFTLASASPELLLKVRGDRAETRPIAGTRPRGSTPTEDERLSGELLLNEKERAEHIMLVDLERNDLGRVCRPGTVEVSERMVLEKYSHVTHIVSHVQGRLAPGYDGLDAVRALFPGGTITGCPKIRCMEILQELEKESRGPFYGSAGWMGGNGDLDLNILIRTALFRKGRVSLRVGAGIVADSVPSKEYEETLHKARALTAARRRSGNP
jgi:anthranilate/para-aminobenzoate synthase component I